MRHVSKMSGLNGTFFVILCYNVFILLKIEKGAKHETTF